MANHVNDAEQQRVTAASQIDALQERVRVLEAADVRNAIAFRDMAVRYSEVLHQAREALGEVSDALSLSDMLGRVMAALDAVKLVLGET